MLLRGKYVNKKALSLAVCLAVSYSSASYALGLGEIESSSHLNQPFRAKINLLSTNATDAKRLKIRVASPDVFSRVGIERPDYLDTISFVPTVENGIPVIMVSSSQPISQPFLNFLIEVSWPNGQLLKEYTVLLDPPILVEAGTAVANNTVGVRAEPKGQKEPVQQNISQAISPTTKQVMEVSEALSQITQAPVATAPTRRGNRASKYRVVRGDTLSKVAKKLRRRGIRDEQMMMALFRANPTAFRKRNINNLKAGALLRRPSSAEARQLDYKQAKSAIYNQSRQWKNYRAKLAKNTVPQQKLTSNNKPKPSVSPTPEENTQARIEVIGSASPAVDTNNLSATGSAKVGQLERELTQARESLAAKANANVELKSRVSELESLLRKKNRLITLKNEQLAELQEKLGMIGDEKTSTKSAGVNIADAGSDLGQQIRNSANEGEGTIVRSGDAANQDKQQLAVVDQRLDTPSIFEQPPQNTAIERPVEPLEGSATGIDKTLVDSSQEANTEESIFDVLSSPLVMGLGGGSLVALLAGWLLMRRKSNPGEYEEYSYNSIDFNEPEFAAGEQTKEAKKLDKTKSDIDDLDFGDTLEKHNNNEKKDSSSTDPNDDVLQEADVYIVYGLHDQAEVELKKAIEKQPDNLYYHAKLLENYQASSNVEAFDKQAKIFLKLKDDTEGSKDKLWKTIAKWAKEIKSESSLFNHSSGKSKSIAAGAAAAVVASGVAVTAGQAFATEKQDDVKDLSDTLTLDDLDLNADTTRLDLTDNENDLNLKDILGESMGESLKATETISDDLDDASLNDLLVDTRVSESAPIVEEHSTELGAEFEDLLDLDLTDLSEDLASLPSNKHDVSNLNLELNNDSDLNKILPVGSPYTSKKDDFLEDNLLGNLDDDISFMDLDDHDDDLKEVQVSTKLDLARAYFDMGDMEGARNTLEEVLMEGNDDQKKEAEELLHQTG
jgi:pilus assembly protein FimV